MYKIVKNVLEKAPGMKIWNMQSKPEPEEV